MRELREIRVYLIAVGMAAAISKLSLFFWTYYNLSGSQPCRELLSLWSNCW